MDLIPNTFIYNVLKKIPDNKFLGIFNSGVYYRNILLDIIKRYNRIKQGRILVSGKKRLKDIENKNKYDLIELTFLGYDNVKIETTEESRFETIKQNLLILKSNSKVLDYNNNELIDIDNIETVNYSEILIMSSNNTLYLQYRNKEIKEIKINNIIKITSGFKHILVLTSNNKMYMINFDGKIIDIYEDVIFVNSFTPPDVLTQYDTILFNNNDIKIDKIDEISRPILWKNYDINISKFYLYSSSPRSYLLIDYEGNLLIEGYNTNYIFGIGNKKGYNKPTINPYIKNVIKIELSELFALFLTSKGEVYMTGKTTQGVFGNENVDEILKIPTKIPNLGFIIDIKVLTETAFFIEE